MTKDRDRARIVEPRLRLRDLRHGNAPEDPWPVFEAAPGWDWAASAASDIGTRQSPFVARRPRNGRKKIRLTYRNVDGRQARPFPRTRRRPTRQIQYNAERREL